MSQRSSSLTTKKGGRKQAVRLEANVTGLTIGIDLGDQWSQLCFLDAAGDTIDEGRVKTTRTAFQARFGPLSPARIALETGTHSLWASELLAELGHEVIVAHIREVRAITGSDRKTDKADAEKLARYARVDPQILHPIQHRDSDQHIDLTLLRARAALVRARTLLINTARSLVKPLGYRLPPSDTDYFAARCREELPELLRHCLLPLVEMIAEMTKQVQQYDERIALLVKTEYQETAPLQTVYGVGPVTALTFVLTLADAKRFERSRDVGCYLGLRPRQRQSGNSDPQLGITKAGNRYLRSLLVECAHRLLSEGAPDSALKRWGQKLYQRGGKSARKRAIVAVARKLAVLLHRLWVRQEQWEPFPDKPRTASASQNGETEKRNFPLPQGGPSRPEQDGSARPDSFVRREPNRVPVTAACGRASKAENQMAAPAHRIGPQQAPVPLRDQTSANGRRE